MNIITIIQARTSSTRFPNKVLKTFKGISYLEILIRRIQKAKKIKKIVVATTNHKSDDKIHKICKKLNIDCYRGKENDVIDRYFQISKKFKAKNVIRLTADCPLLDPLVIDKIVKNFFLHKVSYSSNILPPTFPDGFDVEVFSYSALKAAWEVSRSNRNLREHVTTYIRESKKFSKVNFKYVKDFSFLRLTLDEPIDLKIINFVLSQFSNTITFGIDDVIKLYIKFKKKFSLNMGIKRNEGKSLIKGQKTWIRAKNIIPGGTMLFSKHPDLFLPKKWPAYFLKTKECKIWDLENNIYNDISFMGVGTNILGYNYPAVEKKVIQTIKNGNMSTLNSVDEILLAEKLVSMHPWAEMVRLTRSGGEANAVAIRIARAATGKENVAVCGYHGWHDWYLSSNIQNNKNLDKHLMPNISTIGVPKNLKKTVFPFDYNNFNQLKKIIDNNDIGVVKMEVERNIKPKDKFLEKIRRICNQKSIVLIFDECTSGFRKTFGGIHKYYGVEPDMCILGKALGNGYAINAILGKRPVMEVGKKSFISSTFWTERIGPAAALQTLKSMEELKSWKIITKIGDKIAKNWIKLAKLHNLQIEVSGLPSIPNFTFKSKSHYKYKTFITQEMLKKNMLASNVVYCSIAHKEKFLNKYFEILDLIFNQINKFQEEKEDINKFLETEVCLTGIRKS